MTGINRQNIYVQEKNTKHQMSGRNQVRRSLKSFDFSSYNLKLISCHAFSRTNTCMYARKRIGFRRQIIIGGKGPSIYDVQKKTTFFPPPPPCPHASTW